MKKKYKVLYFMDGIGNAGGIQEMVIKWLENMDTNNIQVDILSYNTGKSDNYKERVEKFGGKVYIVQTYVSRKYFWKSFKELNEFFKTHNDYDVLHAHSSSKAIFIMLYAKIYGIKTRILHSHTTQIIMSGILPRLAATIFRPITNALSTDYFACSPEAGDFLFGRHASRQGKIKIIHNAINIEEYYYDCEIRKYMREKLNIDNKFVIGNVGRFKEPKNHTFLIDIFKEISILEPNSILLLVGNGELEESIKRKVKKVNLEEKVIFLGFRKDVNNLMQAMDILVMPSIFEGLPVTAVEAQAVGLPCVFSDAITKEAAILDESIYLSLTDSPKKWAKEIISINKKYKRDNKTKLIKKRGYDIAIETKKLEKFYKKVVD